jgi:hypothetical protein
MQGLRPDLDSGTSPHLTLTATSFDFGCVQVLALIGSSYGHKSLYIVPLVYAF